MQFVSRASRPPRTAETAADGVRAGDGMIRVLVAEDEAMVLGALCALLDLEDDI